jgi:hypothetical protein
MNKKSAVEKDTRNEEYPKERAGSMRNSRKTVQFIWNKRKGTGGEECGA